MKSIDEATTVRHNILYAFEVAERISDPVQRKAWLTFVIVGAGPTGVELAGAIGEISRQTLKHDFRSIRPEEARIILLDGLPRVLMPFPEDLAQKAQRSLERLRAEIRPQPPERTLRPLRPVLRERHQYSRASREPGRLEKHTAA